MYSLSHIITEIISRYLFSSSPSERDAAAAVPAVLAGAGTASGTGLLRAEGAAVPHSSKGLC